MPNPFSRPRSVVGRRGVRGTAALDRVKPPPPIEVEQRWYRLDLTDVDARTLDEEFILRRAGLADLPLFEQLPSDPSVTAPAGDVVPRASPYSRIRSHLRTSAVAAWRPGAWTRVAEELRKAGQRLMFTKVDVTNVASTRAVEKIGFREAALMRIARKGWRFRIHVDVTHPDPDHAWIAALERG